MGTATPRGVNLVNSAHASYIREIYIVILALGFPVFAMQFIAGLVEHHVFNVLQLVYFVTIYYFMAYEWVAYALLINKYPYKIDAGIASQGRFYADLIALAVKSGLIFIAAHVGSIISLRFIATLFLLWHAVIIGWYLFAKHDYPDLPRSASGVHLKMVGCYATYLVLLILGDRLMTGNSLATPTITVFLCLTVVGFATWRKRELIIRLSQ